jgi:hypothetical protein
MMPPQPPEPEPTAFVVELHAVPGAWRTAPITRLRWFLKRALRDCGLRCTDLRVADQDKRPHP